MDRSASMIQLFIQHNNFYDNVLRFPELQVCAEFTDLIVTCTFVGISQLVVKWAKAREWHRRVRLENAAVCRGFGAVAGTLQVRVCRSRSYWIEGSCRIDH